MMSNERRRQAQTPVVVAKDNLKKTFWKTKRTFLKKLPFEKQKEQNNEYLN